MKKTKIVSTLGPASNTTEIIANLIEAGANVFRFNFSHGDYEEHGQRMGMARDAVKQTGKMVAFMLDTKGAEIRTTEQAEGKIDFTTGDIVRISMDSSLKGTKEKLAVTYPGLIDDVHVGGHVLFDDGLIDVKVTEIDRANNELVTIVQNSNTLGSKKGVNAPGVSINLPGLTEKDASDIRFGLEQGIDYIAASFVRKAQDVLDIRAVLEAAGDHDVRIFPKIESQEGIDNADEILAVSDGIMVARGDMGVEIPVENVPIEQKKLIKKCNAAGKPVITATQMLDSMQHNPRPTRAEATDVANAIFDGTDATMLSGESANGLYPVEAVAQMARIAEHTEAALEGQDIFALRTYKNTDVTEAIGQSVAHTAKNLGIKTIVAATGSGRTARMISKYRPKADILAITFDEKTQRGLAVSYGVFPVVAEKPSNTDEMFELAVNTAKKEGFAQVGDVVIITAGVPVGQTGSTNLMKIQEVK